MFVTAPLPTGATARPSACRCRRTATSRPANARDRRLTPHTPCPLVQPLPMRVPNPTSSPAPATQASGRGEGPIAGRSRQPEDEAREQQAQEEREAPAALAAQLEQASGGDAADAGDAAAEAEQQRRGQPDQHAANEAAPGCEFRHASGSLPPRPERCSVDHGSGRGAGAWRRSASSTRSTPSG